MLGCEGRVGLGETAADSSTPGAGRTLIRRVICFASRTGWVRAGIVDVQLQSLRQIGSLAHTQDTNHCKCRFNRHVIIIVVVITVVAAAAVVVVVIIIVRHVILLVLMWH